MEPMSPPGDAFDTRRAARLTPAMRWVLIGVGTLVVVGVVVAIWLMTLGPGAGLAGATPTRTPTPTSISAAPGPVPGATPTTGSEVKSPDSEDSTTPFDGLPPLPTPTALVEAPLPATAAAEGSLVKGFPELAAGPSGGSDVLNSSIASEGDTMQVTLVARTDASADDVRAHYRDTWSRLGLTETASTDGTATTFGDTYTSLSLAFTPASGTGTVYVIYGVLRTG